MRPAIDFSQARLWVVGDLILDVYLHGSASRISPEAPVPVVLTGQRLVQPGGAANTAANCARLGGRVTLFGVVGDDEAGRELTRSVCSVGVDSGLVIDGARPTTTKTRILSGGQQMMRLDHETRSDLAATVEARLVAELDAALPPQAIIVSDYGKGCVTDGVMAAVRRHKASHGGVAVVVDPRRRDFRFYQGCDVLKPNLAEAAAAAGCGPAEVFDREPTRRLLDAVPGAALLVTCGADGMVLISNDGVQQRLRTDAQEVFDVTGAGDTVAAAYALSLATGHTPYSAALVASAAAGIAVRHVGTYAVSDEELRRALYGGRPSRKWMSVADAQRHCAEIRAGRGRVVFTNGCFDLVHSGHVHLLEEARRKGDCLVVAVNSDDSVRRLKGHSRPVNGLEDRIAVLSGLASVDVIVAFDEDHPRALVERLRPDVLVKGADYLPEQIVGAELVRSWGGVVETVAFLDGRSTTAIIDKTRQTT